MSSANVQSKAADAAVHALAAISAALIWSVGTLVLVLTTSACSFGSGCESVRPSMELNLRAQTPLVLLLVVGVFVKHRRLDLLRRTPCVLALLTASIATFAACYAWANSSVPT